MGVPFNTPKEACVEVLPRQRQTQMLIVLALIHDWQLQGGRNILKP